MAEAADCNQDILDKLDYWRDGGIRLIFGGNASDDFLEEILTRLGQLHLAIAQASENSSRSVMEMLDRAIKSLNGKIDDLSENVSEVRTLALANRCQISDIIETLTSPKKSSRSKHVQKHLPNRNLLFTGRLELLKKIEGWITDENKKIVALCGLGGVGKTTLAIEVCWKWEDKFPSGIFWLTADDQSIDQEELIRGSVQRLVKKLAVRDEGLSPVDTLCQYLESLESGFLLVLDNLDQIEFSVLVDKLVVTGQWLQNDNAKLMITTRLRADQIEGYFQHPVETFTIQTFDNKEGSLFLERKVGIPPENSEGERISEEVGGLPLALDQVATSSFYYQLFRAKVF